MRFSQAQDVQKSTVRKDLIALFNSLVDLGLEPPEKNQGRGRRKKQNREGNERNLELAIKRKEFRASYKSGIAIDL